MPPNDGWDSSPQRDPTDPMEDSRLYQVLTIVAVILIIVSLVASFIIFCRHSPTPVLMG